MAELRGAQPDPVAETEPPERLREQRAVGTLAQSWIGHPCLGLGDMRRYVHHPLTVLHKLGVGTLH
jgi:hypothetical protein